MENLSQELATVLAKIKEAQSAAGRSEKGRLLAIAATEVEKASWALEKAESTDS